MSTVEQLGSAAAARVGELLARTCFAERVEAARTGGFATYEPWPPVQEGAHGGGLGEDLWRLAHLGVVERERFDDALWADLCAIELAADAEPGRFELTAHRSLIAARDRPRGSVRGGVHIGEDSLRFAEAILGVAPRGVALDVGSGSGISTLRAGAHVRAGARDRCGGGVPGCDGAVDGAQWDGRQGEREPGAARRL